MLHKHSMSKIRHDQENLTLKSEQFLYDIGQHFNVEIDTTLRTTFDPIELAKVSILSGIFNQLDTLNDHLENIENK